MQSIIRRATRALAGLAGTLVAAGAIAQAWPNRPVTIVVPFPPGGVTDQTARLVGAKLAENIKQSVVVENRPGAGGQIAASYVIGQRADGHTLFVANVGSHAINQSLFTKLSYDPFKDFEPVTNMILAPTVLAVPANHPAKTARELFAYIKANPGKVSYGSQSVGAGGHLNAEMVRAKEGFVMEHVPYKGSAPALADLIQGRIDFIFDPIVTTLPFIRDNRIRALALGSSQRSPLLPDVPTFAEAGIGGYEMPAWFGIATPAGTPKPVIDQLNAEFTKVLRAPDIQKRLVDLGAIPDPTTPAAFGAFWKAETEKLGKIVKDSGAKVD
jgi:tripartite-type tricarboxylate transporter receptor subunit TctC